MINIEANINNQEQVNLSQFTDDIHYVPLEIKDDLAFVGIWDCEFSDKYILAKDLSKCFLYDYKGKIISKIGNQGRGPGEYQYVRNVGFGSQNKINLQSLYDLLEYNLDGSFSKKYKNCFLINGDFIGTWLPVNDSLVLAKISSSKGNEENKALLINKKGEIKNKFKNYILFDRVKPLAASTEQFANIYQFQNEIFFKEIYNDTLFYLTHKFILTPKYRINLGKFEEPMSERKKISNERDPAIQASYIHVLNIFQTSECIFLDCSFRNHFQAKRLTPKVVFIPNYGEISHWGTTDEVLGIYSKTTEKLIFCKPTSTDNPQFTTGLFNDIDAGPRFLPKQQVNDSTLVMWIEAKQLKDHVASDDFKNNVPKYPEKKKELEELANKITVFDNPVLMFVTFKK